MTITKKVAAISSAIGLAAILGFAGKADGESKMLKGWGIPNFEMITTSLVTDNLQNIKFGQKPTTVKVYNLKGIMIEEYSAKGKTYMVIVKSLSSPRFEIYTSSKGDYFENAWSR